MKTKLSLLFLLLPLLVAAQKQFKLTSPNGKLETNINIGKTIDYSVSHGGDLMLDKSTISVVLSDGSAFGVNPRLSGSDTKSVKQTIDAPVYKRKKIADNYNELSLKFNGNYRIIFRAYNDGIAYRFVSTSKKAFVVKNEQAEFNFAADNKAYIPYVKHKRNSLEEQLFNSFENTYEHINISAWDEERLAFSPLLVECVNGKKIAIAEADLMNYPGMFLYPSDKANGLKGIFAPYPKELKQGGHNNLQVLVNSREDYIAKFNSGGNFPWRVLIVSENDAELADSDMIYKLATPSQGDFSWVKPGKVAWDWWNDWNLYGVDFESGVNNETYQYYIDFASQHNIEYVILDEGWAVNKKADLFQVVPEINLEKLVAYATERNVGLILWAGYYAFDRDMEAVCKRYSEMGFKGFKVDFMDRDDQIMVDFHRRGAEMGAKYKMLIDYHGTYKPTGLQRTYPNVINFEGVNGLEQLKWSPKTHDQVTYDVTIPFIRMIAGPIDYTQGAMRNATRQNYHPANSEAMSQGTRCHQLAEYVIFESPLNMLCDNPSNYMRELECTEFIATVPTIWDNTVALSGKVGEHIAIARQKNGEWYIGALNNWEERVLEIDLSFLEAGDYTAEIFRDGINANRAARDYKKETKIISAGEKITINMKNGGGWVAKLIKK